MRKDTHKIAIVYDWIDKWGGVERVLISLHEAFPKAVFYTSYFDSVHAPWAQDFNIVTSFIQKLPRFIKKNRIVSFFLYPIAFESFDFSSYDCVVSVTSSFAKGIITKPGTTHLCYLLTPTRYLWSHIEMYLSRINRAILAPFIQYIRSWDMIAAMRPDSLLSLSRTTSQRCIKYYHRESRVLYPPFDLCYWEAIRLKLINHKGHPYDSFGHFYLVVSRLETYKKIDLVINVFNQYKDKVLVIVGKGSLTQKLKRKAASNIYFLDTLISDFDLGWLYGHAKALIMPQEEDFGYTALEAQFFCCPVIAYKKGGALETVVDGKTGIYFDIQDEEGLKAAVERFDDLEYNLKHGMAVFTQKHLNQFSKISFINSINSIVASI